MHKIVFLTVFFIVLMTFLADPAPVSVDISELILIILPLMIGVLSFSITKNSILQSSEINLLLAIIFYLAYLLISALLGVINGVPLTNVARSIGPYINFFPLLLIGFLPTKILSPRGMGLVFILIGLLQASYNVFLYLTHSSTAFNTLDVLIKRITLIDSRTTLPLILGVSILPSIFFSTLGTKKNFLNLFCIGLILFGMFASIVTLTRAIILSILFGWIIFISCYLYQQRQIKTTSLSSILKKFSKYAVFLMLFIIILLNFHSIQLLETGLAARFYHYADFNHTDYSNGRLYDEWIPALNTWMNSGVVGMFFGIGAGNSFTVLSGEERTYIHNLCIYTLVYGGFFGLFTCLWLYYTIFKILIIRAIETNHRVYLAFAALLASMFFYGQLFAVHKDLAFNAMLFLIMALALNRPAHYSPNQLGNRRLGYVWN